MEQLHLCVGYIRISVDFIVKITLWPSFGQEGNAVPVCLMAMTRDVWGITVKLLMPDTSLLGKAIIGIHEVTFQKEI